MISSRYRFHGYGSLRYVYKNGRTLRSPFLSIRFIANSRRKNSRFAVVVSKKVAKQAVKRNRIRRRIFEIIRLQINNIEVPHDVVVTVFDEKVADIEHQHLQKTITQLLEKAGIVKINQK